MGKHHKSVFLEVIFRSRIENVWRAWTDPALIMHWFGSDPNGNVISAEVDPRQGGYFSITFQDSDLTQHTCSGIYEEVNPPEKLTFSWQWKAEPGVESFVRVLLSPQGTFTRMQFEHSDFGTASKHAYARGWETTFLKLERMLTDLPTE